MPLQKAVSDLCLWHRRRHVSMCARLKGHLLFECIQNKKNFWGRRASPPQGRVWQRACKYLTQSCTMILQRNKVCSVHARVCTTMVPGGISGIDEHPHQLHAQLHTTEVVNLSNSEYFRTPGKQKSTHAVARGPQLYIVQKSRCC